MLSQFANQTIETWRLGFVASADEQGRVNLSPKGTFVVLDDHRIAFAEIASPRTIANIIKKPEIEINFVDILSRRGIRIRGNAQVVGRAEPEFEELKPLFVEHWSDLETKFNAFVIVDVRECKLLQSPIYQMGASETDLRSDWKDRIQRMSA